MKKLVRLFVFSGLAIHSAQIYPSTDYSSAKENVKEKNNKERYSLDATVEQLITWFNEHVKEDEVKQFNTYLVWQRAYLSQEALVKQLEHARSTDKTISKTSIKAMKEAVDIFKKKAHNAKENLQDRIATFQEELERLLVRHHTELITFSQLYDQPFFMGKLSDYILHHLVIPQFKKSLPKLK